MSVAYKLPAVTFKPHDDRNEFESCREIQEYLAFQHALGFSHSTAYNPHPVPPHPWPGER